MDLVIQNEIGVPQLKNCFFVVFFTQSWHIFIMENIFTPKTEIDCRIRKLQAELTEHGIDAALILQNTDLFYFSGTIQQSHLYVPAQGPPLLMVKRSLERAIAESPIETIVPISSSKQIPAILSQKGYEIPKTLGLELDVLPANSYLSFCQIFKSAKITDISHGIRLIRAIKSEYEIALIRQAARCSEQLASCVKDFLQEGISEIELSSKLESVARKLGHQGIVRMRLWGAELFFGHLMSGASAAVPSYLSSPTGGMGISPVIAQGASHKLIARHEPILVDYAFACQGYVSDLTRIFAIGDLPDELIKAHDAMLSVQNLIINAAKQGINAGELYDMAIQHVRDLGYAENFMGAGQERVRFVGHGVGLELDEYPFIAKGQTLTLQKGMTIAFEPKLIFPGRGVVGIENTFLMTDIGLEQITIFDENIIIV